MGRHSRQPRRARSSQPSREWRPRASGSGCRRRLPRPRCPQPVRGCGRPPCARSAIMPVALRPRRRSRQDRPGPRRDRAGSGETLPRGRPEGRVVENHDRIVALNGGRVARRPGVASTGRRRGARRPGGRAPDGTSECWAAFEPAAPAEPTTTSGTASWPPVMLPEPEPGLVRKLIEGDVRRSSRT